MKSDISAIVAGGLFLMSMGAVADKPAPEIHAYALGFEVSQSAAPGGCPAATNPPGNTNGVIWIARNVVYFGPGVPSGLEARDVLTVVCNGDTPQQILQKLVAAIRQGAVSRGYDVKPVNVIVPMLQRGE